MNIIEKLFENKDIKFKLFNDKIINTNMNTIGVRTPIIKSLAKKIYNEGYDFSNYEFHYYEEVLLYGYVISYTKEPIELLDKLNSFIDKIDNWAICDMVCASSKSLSKNKKLTLDFIKENIYSNNPWRVRVCFVLMLDYFIEEKYLDTIFDFCDNDKNDFYYVMMAKAWLISECFVMYPSKTLKYLKHTNIDKITYNKAITKICESYRVDLNYKKTLKTMKKK